MLGKIVEGREGSREDEMVEDGTTDSMDMRLSKLRERVKDRKAVVLQSMRSQTVGHEQ